MKTAILLIFFLLLIPAKAPGQQVFFEYRTLGTITEKACLSFSKRSDIWIKKNHGFCSHSFQYDYFRKTKPALLLDFDSMVASEMVAVNLDSLSESGFQEVGSDFNAHGISLNAELRRKRISVAMEMGFAGGILLKPSKLLNFLNQPHHTQPVEFIDNKTAKVFKNRGIGFLGSYYGNSVSVLDDVNSSVGIAFLQGFNWVIDFRKNKVYARKNARSIGSHETEKSR